MLIVLKDQKRVNHKRKPLVTLSVIDSLSLVESLAFIGWVKSGD